MRRDYSKLSIVAVLFTLLYTAWLTAQETVAPRPGDVVFQTDFDTPQERAAWSKADFAQWETGYQNTVSLCVTVSPEQSLSGSMIHLPLDLTRYREHRLLFECMAKAERVSKPSERYLGVKFMLHYASESTGLHWQNQNGVDGTFDWRKLQVRGNDRTRRLGWPDRPGTAGQFRQSLAGCDQGHGLQGASAQAAETTAQSRSGIQRS